MIGVQLGGDEPPEVGNGFTLLTLLDMAKGEELTRRELSAADFVIRIDLPGMDMLRFDAYADAIAVGYDTAKRALPALDEALGGG